VTAYKREHSAAPKGAQRHRLLGGSSSKRKVAMAAIEQRNGNITHASPATVPFHGTAAWVCSASSILPLPSSSMASCHGSTVVASSLTLLPHPDIRARITGSWRHSALLAHS
jgi:hypothetical protein